MSLGIIIWPTAVMVVNRFNITLKRPRFSTPSSLRKCKAFISQLLFLVERNAGFILSPVVSGAVLLSEVTSGLQWWVRDVTSAPQW